MKVYPFKIPKKPRENIILQIDRAQRFYDKLHQHEEIQLSYIISGKGKLVVGNSVTTFGAGDFVAIGTNLPHLFLSSPDAMESHMASIFFTRVSFGETFFDNQEMQGLQPIWSHLPYGFKVTGNNYWIKGLFLELENENKLQLFIKLLGLLEHLVGVEKIPIIQSPYTVKIGKGQGQRLQLVFDYVMQNFQSQVQLEGVAKKIHMDKNAFCRFFKQRTNKTFFQFLTEIRIQHACERIDEDPEMPISEIAIQAGYHTISNFNRQFKKVTKMNPREYRNKSTGHV